MQTGPLRALSSIEAVDSQSSFSSHYEGHTSGRFYSCSLMMITDFTFKYFPVSVPPLGFIHSMSDKHQLTEENLKRKNEKTHGVFKHIEL